MKELVLKRRQELEDICSKIHIQPDPSTAADKANAMIDSGKAIAFCLKMCFLSLLVLAMHLIPFPCRSTGSM